MKKYLIILFMFLLPLLSGCSLRSIDDALGRGFEKAKNGDFSGLFDGLMRHNAKDVIESLPDVGDFDFKSLNKDQKAFIDDWLGKNGYNRYGDSEGTDYASGTPLIDSETGEPIERYHYIIEHIPDLVEKIKGVKDTAEPNAAEATETVEPAEDGNASVDGQVNGNETPAADDGITAEDNELPPNNF